MRIGLVISSIIHAGLVAWALVTLERPPPIKDVPPPDPVVTEIISEADLAKIRKGSRTAKIDEAVPQDNPAQEPPKKEAPKPKPVAAPPPPPPAAEPPPPPEPVKPPEPAKAEPPAPEPPPPAPDKAALDQKLADLALQQAREEELKKAEAEARAKAEAEAKAKAEAEARAKAAAKAKADKARAEAKAKADREKAEKLAKEKSKLDTDRLSALLDKTPDQRQAPAAAPAPATPTKDKGPVRGDKQGQDARNAANEASALLAAIVGRIRDRGCWNIQAGGELASNQVPRVQFELNPDGSIRGEPRILNSQPSPQFQLAADAAKSAVIKCQPFLLPPDKYNMWKRVTLDFDPREMFQ